MVDAELKEEYVRHIVLEDNIIISNLLTIDAYSWLLVYQ